MTKKKNCFRFFVALGELAEQPRPCLALANLVGTAPEDVRVGMPIQIAYQEIPGEENPGGGAAVRRGSRPKRSAATPSRPVPLPARTRT
jgi:hypothetical protein